jgi:hypothetical protein
VAHRHGRHIPFGTDSRHQLVGVVTTFFDTGPHLDGQRNLTKGLVHPYQYFS